jgi:hypothetical protein
MSPGERVLDALPVRLPSDVPVLQNPAARFQTDQPISVGRQALSGSLAQSRSAGLLTGRAHPVVEQTDASAMYSS